MPQATPARARRSAKTALPAPNPRTQRLDDALTIAEEQGLLAGGRTLTVRGRMPTLLVEQARRKTGILSDSKLLEAALASIAVADDYGEWLLSRSGSVSQDLDLEF